MAAKYYTILTEVGKTKVANAAALGRQIKLTHLAVGDGDGSEYDPVESQPLLRQETYRTPISHLATDAQNPNWVIAEGMIPVDVGGWFVREVGLFDEDGDLFAIGKYPETYKPTLAEGTGRDLYIRFIMVVSNTSAIDLKIDPTVAIATRNWVENEIGVRTDLVFSNVNAMKSATGLKAGQKLSTLGFSIEGDGGGCQYIVKSGVESNGRTIHALNGGLFAVAVPINGALSTIQAGVSPGEDVSLGLAIPTILDVGATVINIPHRRVSFNGTQDITGITLIGNDTVYHTGEFIGGNRIGIVREAQSISLVNDISQVPPQTSKSRVKTMIKVAQTIEGLSSPFGETYCILSPSSFGGVAMFFLGNGLGGSGANDLGAPYDRLRVWNSYLADDGISIVEPISETGSVLDTAYDLLNLYFSRNLSTRWSNTGDTQLLARHLEAGATSTFKINAGKRTSNIAVYTSQASTSDGSISVDGQLVKTFSAKGDSNRIKVIEFEIPEGAGEPLEVTVSSGSGLMYLFGADMYLVSETPSNSIKLTTSGATNEVRKTVMHSYTPMTYAGNGASLDTVMVDADGKFGGSYHGGDLADNQSVVIKLGRIQYRCDTSNYTEENPALKMQVGESITGRDLQIRYVGTINNADKVRIRMTFDFGVDGGCQVLGWYTADVGADARFKTIYTGMHSSSRNLIYTPHKNYALDATNTTDELTNNNRPFYQYGSSSQQLCIYPHTVDPKNSSILARLWDTDNYLKYYYTPIAVQGGGSVILKAGQTFGFGCLYQYGAAMV
ncbi:hypothetical protein CGG80_22540 [Vibrio parahaemolyticus]|uniref:phage tail protein n=1 Tax=Vibrio parahaemolyticus TaxID=670 RepID=UPI00111E28FF|nr:phage tail protein [Vibrio parahaemolyticus]TOR12371.1 hypothetical protein CGG80_22540 [Vibrio parahaemolyticus]